MSDLGNGIHALAHEFKRNNMPLPTFIVSRYTLKVMERMLMPEQSLIEDSSTATRLSLTFAGVMFEEGPR